MQAKVFILLLFVALAYVLTASTVEGKTLDHIFNRNSETFFDMLDIWTDFENLVSLNNKICIRNLFFVSPNEILLVKSFGLTLFHITVFKRISSLWK